MLRYLQGIAYYERKYKEAVGFAKQTRASLIDVFDCDDQTFVLDADTQLKALDLGGFTRITVPLSDDLDFTKDPSVGTNNILGDVKDLSNGQVRGFTSVVEKDGLRRTIIVMRKGVGREPSTSELRCEIRALKVAALSHEIGHADDIEKEIHWKRDIRNMIGSEVYAHHFACRTLIEQSCFFALELYVDGVVKMMKAPCEYVRIAAEQVVKSPEFKKYRAVCRDRKDDWR
jgi:hypothetical protein